MVLNRDYIYLLVYLIDKMSYYKVLLYLYYVFLNLIR